MMNDEQILEKVSFMLTDKLKLAMLLNEADFEPTYKVGNRTYNDRSWVREIIRLSDAGEEICRGKLAHLDMLWKKYLGDRPC